MPTFSLFPSSSPGAWKRALAHNRIYLLWFAIFTVMSLAAPNFFTLRNQASILRFVSPYALVAVGFTIVLIARQLDLSVASTMTLGAMLAVGLQPQIGWGASIVVAALCGLAVGFVNGFLVAWARVDSFIATLGTMIVVRGIFHIYCGGDSLQPDSGDFGMLVTERYFELLTPGILFVIAIVFCFEFLLKRTTAGRGFYLVGSNPSAAWHAGLSPKRYVMAAFLISGCMAALGGALLGVMTDSARTNMGDKALMFVIAAVIVGGASMSGGKGSVVKSLVALIALNTLANGFNFMGAGENAKKITNGLVLGAIILYDAILVARQERNRGTRHELLEELAAADYDDDDDWDDERSSTMDPRKDHTLPAIVAVASVACVAIVAIFAMFFLSQSQPTPAPLVLQASPTGGAVANPEASPISIEEKIAALRSVDKRLLILPPDAKEVPPRPENVEAFTEEEPERWWDMEFSGWGVKKVNMPQSPGDGPRGKKVTHLKFQDHAYTNAMSRGMQKVADVYGIEIKTMLAENDANVQAQQVEQVIIERPDLVIINPVDAKSCAPLFRALNEAGIPVIASNLLPAHDAHAYILSWTGPDDWRQFRKLAREFAERMDYKGAYCIVRHYTGASPYFSRTFSVITELKKIAPEMKLLAMQTTGLKAEPTREVVSGWLTKYGDELKGIVSADDSGTQAGINEAVASAGREDIIRVAAGNSKVGMDFIKEGKLHAITYQSPEADGAIPMQLAADWFAGKEIPAIRYLPIEIITKKNVGEFLPAQW